VAAVGVMLTGVCLQGINGVYVAHLKDIGMKPEFTATVASAFALLLTATKIIVGWIYDRFGLKAVMLVCPICAIFSYVLLLIISPTPVGMLMAFAFCGLYALAIPLETLVIPLIVNDLFGSLAYDKMLGIFSAVNYAGYALGAPLVNLCYDMRDSYNIALVICTVLMILICVSFRFVLREVEKVKLEIAAKITAE
jgi:MFS family permease